MVLIQFILSFHQVFQGLNSIIVVSLHKIQMLGGHSIQM